MKKANKYLSENGHLKELYINLYIDAHLLDKVNELPEDVLSHVKNCTKCMHDILLGVDLMEEDGTPVNTSDHPFFGENKDNVRNFKKNQKFSFVKIAASIILLMGLGVTAMYLLKKEPVLDTKEQMANVITDTPIEDSLVVNENIQKEIPLALKTSDEKQKGDAFIVKNDEPKELIAENKLEGEEFKVSPIIISALGMQNRSGYIEIIQPLDSVEINNNQAIKFSWKSEIDEEIKLKIFNYKDELVFESDALGGNEFVISHKFESGAYYWKLEGRKKIYHLGLFFVGNN